MKILFQGDSITDGNRYKDEASRWDLNHQIGHSYAYMVTGKLMGEYPRRYVCVNRGVSGNNVLSLRERWQKDAVEEKLSEVRESLEELRQFMDPGPCTITESETEDSREHPSNEDEGTDLIMVISAVFSFSSLSCGSSRIRSIIGSHTPSWS